jgi:hypothetical protein
MHAAQLAAAAAAQDWVLEALSQHAQACSHVAEAASATEQWYAAAASSQTQSWGGAERQQQQEVPALLDDAVNAVYAAEQQLAGAAWADRPLGSTPSAQELMEAAVAAKGLADMADSAWDKAAEAGVTAPDSCDELLPVVHEALQGAVQQEVAAAECLALAYHALTLRLHCESSGHVPQS